MGIENTVADFAPGTAYARLTVGYPGKFRPFELTAEGVRDERIANAA